MKRDCLDIVYSFLSDERKVPRGRTELKYYRHLCKCGIIDLNGLTEKGLRLKAALEAIFQLVDEPIGEKKK